MEERKRITFLLRVIHNQIKVAMHKNGPDVKKGPKTQLQGGILGYLYHHQDQPVYQKDLEKEFRISGATVSNSLQVMEREGLIVRSAQDKDGRLKRIQMTPEACQNHAKIERHMDWIGNRVLEGMSDEEVSELYRLLGILLKNLEEMTAEPEETMEEAVGRASGEADRALAASAEGSGSAREAPVKEAEPEGDPEEAKTREGPAQTDAEAKREQENQDSGEDL